jgi:hypothetical protein
MNPSPPIIEIHGEMSRSRQATSPRGSACRWTGSGQRCGGGIIYSVVERGVGEDAGRLRLTFRYRARAWTVVVQRDGTLNEARWSQG